MSSGQIWSGNTIHTTAKINIGYVFAVLMQPIRAFAFGRVAQARKKKARPERGVRERMWKDGNSSISSESEIENIYTNEISQQQNIKKNVYRQEIRGCRARLVWPVAHIFLSRLLDKIFTRIETRFEDFIKSWLIFFLSLYRMSIDKKNCIHTLNCESLQSLPLIVVDFTEGVTV